MKRGKRQVVELDPEPLKTQQNSSQFTNQYFPNLPNNMPNHQFNQPYQTQSKGTSILKPSETSFSQCRPIADEADQKKRKIQLLKQKYLKKTKPQDAKIAYGVQQTQTVQNHQVNTEQKTSLTNVIQKRQIINNEPQLAIVESSRMQQKTQENSNHLETKFQPKRQLFSKENSLYFNPQKINKEPEQKMPETPKQQDIPKPPIRVQGRNPPPPPMKKNNLPPPVLHPNENPEPTHVQNVIGQQNLQTKTVPLPQKQQLIEESIDLNQRTERSDNSSFAPPSLSINEGSKQEKKGGSIVPPPPNRNMKQILSKKLSSQKPVPKPPKRVQITPVDEFKDQSIQNPSIAKSNVLSKGANQKDLSAKQNYNYHIDDEYDGVESEPSSNHLKLSKNKMSLNLQVNPLNFVGEWLGSPELTLKQLFPSLKQDIEFYCLHKNLNLQISSNHLGFTPQIAQFVEAFIINNTIKYTQDQKRVAQSICLNFFYSNATEFSDIFLVLLIKIGEGYFQKYEKAFEDKLEIYLSRILFFKNLFLSEELNTFISFCIERNWVRQSNFIQFLMFGENTQLLGLIQNTEIEELKNKLAVLSFCKLNLKNRNLMALYLKLISSIQVELAKNGLIQKILNHLKELDIPENLYQFTKQLKLKLLKNFENNSQNDTQSFGGKIQQNGQSYVSSSNEISKDTGLFGYFNINKAIDKIKTSTQKALGAVEKPKKPVEEEKKDDIVYDPIRKRYIINGEIPEDENDSQHQQLGSSEVKSKAPPPPPLGTGRKAPPSMHNKKPGPRIAGNRYA